MGSRGYFRSCALCGLVIVATGLGAFTGVASAQDYRDYRDQSGYGRDSFGRDSRYDRDSYGGDQQGYGQDGYGRGQQGYGQDGGNDGGYGRGGRQQGYGGQQRPPASPREARCQDLERQLVSDARGVSQDDLRRIDDDLRAADRAYQKVKGEADRSNCYEDMFIFGRSLKRTPRCLDLDRQVELAHQRMDQLQHQKDAYGGKSGSRRMRQDDLIAELARNGCGENYTRQYEANRRSQSPFSFWDDEEGPGPRDDGYRSQPSTVVPYDSYRTMCVRLCDGYYFPISYSTLPSHFKDDEARCRDQCSAPAELYVYRNPGEEVEQMVSLSGKRYTDLPNAFRNRKQYVRGCSCKRDEYSLEEISKSEQSFKEAAATKRAAAKAAQRAGKVGSGESSAGVAASEAEGQNGQPDVAPDNPPGSGRAADPKSQKNTSQPGKEGALSTPSMEKLSQNILSSQ